jgi:hypothetical protein
LWNSLSHRSDTSKLPFTVMISFGPGILSLSPCSEVLP